VSRSYQDWSEECTEVTTDKHLLNHLIGQSLTDLRVLVTNHDTGLYPAAGIPWFAVPFGGTAPSSARSR